MAESPTLHLTAIVTREGDWYVARCLEIEATSQGETIEQPSRTSATWSRSTSRKNLLLPSHSRHW
jgi:hypothetical protein